MLSQFVVSSAVVDEDFQWQLENSPASVAILLMDPLTSTDTDRQREAKAGRAAFLVRLLDRQDLWSGVLFEGSAGALLFKKNRVESFRPMGTTSVAGHRYVAVEFKLLAGYQNPPTAVAVGVCYKVAHHPRASAVWSPGFITQVQEAVRAQGVRFLGGVFDCPRFQVEELAVQCGAAPNCPFAQVWTDQCSQSGGRRSFHPAFIFAIGPATPQYANPDEQPAMPAWLLANDNVGSEARRSCGAALAGPAQCDSALLRARRPIADIPRFERDPAYFNNLLPSLGGVKQKVAQLAWWRPSIHQLLLHVGTARQGKGAAGKKRKRQKRTRGQDAVAEARGAPQLRNTGRRLH